jgi:hypothetical protein
MNTRRKTPKCPKCDGDVELKDGHIECLVCDYKQVDRRKPINEDLNEWRNV